MGPCCRPRQAAIRHAFAVASRCHFRRIVDSRTEDRATAILALPTETRSGHGPQHVPKTCAVVSELCQASRRSRAQHATVRRCPQCRGRMHLPNWNRFAWLCYINMATHTEHKNKPTSVAYLASACCKSLQAFNTVIISNTWWRSGILALIYAHHTVTHRDYDTIPISTAW